MACIFRLRSAFLVNRSFSSIIFYQALFLRPHLYLHQVYVRFNNDDAFSERTSQGKISYKQNGCGIRWQK